MSCRVWLTLRPHFIESVPHEKGRCQQQRGNAEIDNQARHVKIRREPRILASGNPQIRQGPTQMGCVYRSAAVFLAEPEHQLRISLCEIGCTKRTQNENGDDESPDTEAPTGLFVVVAHRRSLGCTVSSQSRALTPYSRSSRDITYYPALRFGGGVGQYSGWVGATCWVHEQLANCPPIKTGTKKDNHFSRCSLPIYLLRLSRYSSSSFLSSAYCFSLVRVRSFPSRERGR